ncbi:hypothetical protein BDZ45DRAFT_751061 [Acephala macrosclerotiorum]|nr:hypothetical protein BDZ45DRAFT_751061 [Acephala macrosclerotiorum]
MSVTDAKMLCNTSTSAALNATVAAGVTVTAKRANGPINKAQSWFGCTNVLGTSSPVMAKARDAVVYSKLAWTSTIPKSLTPGNYLIRHKLLALRQSNTPQFYPECAQIVVTGSGTQVPSGAFLTSIPGYATASDPGVLIDIYSSKATTYTCPVLLSGPAMEPPLLTQSDSKHRVRAGETCLNHEVVKHRVRT